MSDHSSDSEEFSSDEEEEYAQQEQESQKKIGGLSLKSKIPNLTVKEETGQESLAQDDKVLLGDDVKLQFSYPKDSKLDKQVLTVSFFFFFAALAKLKNKTKKNLSDFSSPK